MNLTQRAQGIFHSNMTSTYLDQDCIFVINEYLNESREEWKMRFDWVLVDVADRSICRLCRSRELEISTENDICTPCARYLLIAESSCPRCYSQILPNWTREFCPECFSDIPSCRSTSLPPSDPSAWDIKNKKYISFLFEMRSCCHIGKVYKD